MSDATSASVPAATVVLVRDGDDGLETLLLRRSSSIAFGGMWAFPGGRVDEADRGGDEEDTARRCAVRESFEEADVVLAPPQLIAFAHWEPPPVIERRYATWFFLAALPAGPDGEVTVDGHEIDEHRWLHPAEVLRLRDDGVVELAPPTWVTLDDLVQCETAADAVSWARSVDGLPRFVTHWCTIDGGAVAMWHGDAGYEASDPAVPGPRNRLWMLDDGWRRELRR